MLGRLIDGIVFLIGTAMTLAWLGLIAVVKMFDRKDRDPRK